MQKEMRKSSEDGSESILETIICEQVLGKCLSHTKGLRWKTTPNIGTHDTSTCVFEKDIGDKYEKLQANGINLKKENVMLKSTISDF
uniref:Uncharacterized protein n=1 Tax=Cucumis melo TaxID=3656 RepID=A0A9I9E9H3_CUCME